MNFDFSPIGPFLAAPLVLFVIYRRFRRSFGQQPLRPLRMQVRIGCCSSSVVYCCRQRCNRSPSHRRCRPAWWREPRWPCGVLHLPDVRAHAAAAGSADPGIAAAGMLQSPLTLGLYFVLPDELLN